MSIFPLSYPILLRSMNTRAGVNYALGFEEKIELRVEIILSIVGVNDLNGGVELSLNGFVKGFE